MWRRPTCTYLQDRSEPFKPHASINVASWQRLEGLVGQSVVLHKDQVPNLEHVRIVLSNQKHIVSQHPSQHLSQARPGVPGVPGIHN